MTKIEEIEQKLCEMERELKNTVNAIEENIGNEISELRGALAELKESKKEGKWKPAFRERFWFRDTYGEIEASDWCNTLTDNHIFENTLLFKSEKECERYWHFMDTVKEKSYEFSKEEWEDEDIVKYYIQYDCYDECWEVESTILTKPLGLDYFKTYEDAQYIIDNFKDELMEYWL